MLEPISTAAAAVRRTMLSSQRQKSAMGLNRLLGSRLALIALKKSRA
jgi:hypothetical protein